MPKDLAIVLNNGSINSAVATAMAAQRYRPIIVFGDSAGDAPSRRRDAFEQQVAHFKPYREYTVSLPFSAESQAAAAAAVADPRRATALGPQLLELLPLISIAARLAVQHQAQAVYLGARVGSNPDELAQATEYFQLWNELIELPCSQPDLEIFTPLLELDPWQVIDTGLLVAAPFERAWSCLEETPDPCWACRGCRAREAAFQQAAKPDPLRATRKV